MKARISPAEAWQAFEDQQYDLAGKLWQTLMQQTVHPGELSRYRMNYTFVLLGQQKYAEAQSQPRLILCKRYERHCNLLLPLV